MMNKIICDQKNNSSYCHRFESIIVWGCGLGAFHNILKINRIPKIVYNYPYAILEYSSQYQKLQNLYIHPKAILYYFTIPMNNKATPTVIGVDIGAFTAKIAAIQRGAVEVITNQANFRETPSIVGYGDGERKIGELGSVKLKTNFKNTVVSPSRYMGLRPNTDRTKIQLGYCPCSSKFEGDNLFFKVDLNGKEQHFTPEQIMASFMTQIEAIIQHNNLEEKLIVFSVPSYYTQIEKKALLNAAQISGLKNVRLAAQTVAIGLDYGSYKKSQMGDGKFVIFVDFGHSALSLSVIKFTQTKMDVLHEQANRNLGCRDIDRKIFDDLAKKFEEKKGLNIRQNKRSCLKLMEAIQKQRKILSGIAETDISIQCLMQDQDINQPFTRQIMFNEAAQIFSQIKTYLESFREEIKKLNIKFDSVELVGGGSRIPKFIEIVQEVFGIPASRTTNSSEGIAQGAALAAVQYSGLFRFHSFNIVDRTAHTIKLQWREDTEADYPEANIQTICDINTYIPLNKQIKIQTTKPTQIMVMYDGLEQQVQRKIATIQCQAPTAGKNQINLNFKINDDQFVTLVSAKDNDGAEIKHTIKYNRVLSHQQILSFKAKQRQMFVKDFTIIRSYEKKNELQSFIYRQKDILNGEQIKKHATPLQKQMIEKYLNEVTEELNNDDKINVNDIQKKKTEIQNSIKKLQQTIRQRKAQMLVHFKELEQLKDYASNTMKQIAQKFRSSKPVTQVYEQIKQIQSWADEALKLSKTKAASELPVVSKQDVDQQYENIKILVNQLVNPQRAQEPPRHQHFEQHYDPENYMYNTGYGRSPRYAQQQPRQQQQRHPQQQQQQQQRRRQQQQQQYDPFANMTRSGFFGPSNNSFFGGMGGMGGFW